MMKFKFQSFVDISTSASSMQVIQWSVGGAEVFNRCRHLFGAYKYFKLGKISVKMVPASTLPVDPLGLSYSSSDPQTVDPRDQMNPGLVRITNGEDIFTNVSGLSAAQQEAMYNTMMLDPRWSKFMLQSGFRRTAVPLYWQIGQLSQDKFPGATINVPNVNGTAVGNGGATVERAISNASSSHALSWQGQWDASSARGLFQVGHRGKLGFLPTDYFQQVPGTDGAMDNQFGINNIPEVSVITCVLPKAYKTVYYYRVFITEEVIFAGLRSAPAITGNYQTIGIDNFVYAYPLGAQPGTNIIGQQTNTNMNNGDDMP
nr:MAG: capsid protein [Smacoviridae sp.]